MPVLWFDVTIRPVRPQAAKDLSCTDEVIAAWNVGIRLERFRRGLRHLVQRLAVRRETPDPAPTRYDARP